MWKGAIRLQLSLMAVLLNVHAQQRVGDSAVSRAIELTKRRQTADKAMLPKTKPPRPVRTQQLDVEKLNRLIKSIDRTWTMPSTNIRDGIGSNFQYKKTCASIFKARHGACQQTGFGVMCFNYCHEQGESLRFKCQDMSDAAYCKTNANYDAFLTKYRKDSYKAKAFIHQMISRCYATAICSSPGLLNSSLVQQEVLVTTTTHHPKHGHKRPHSAARTPAARSPSGSAAIQRRVGSKLNANLRQKPASMNRHAAAGTIGGAPDGATPKYVPFWQRLLKKKTSAPTTVVTTVMTTTTEEPLVVEEVTEADEEEEANEVEDNRPSTSSSPDVDAEESPREIEEIELTEAPTTETTARSFRTTPPFPPPGIRIKSTPGRTAAEPVASTTRMTWKPQKVTTRTPRLPGNGEFHRTGSAGERYIDPMDMTAATATGFWNKFQPGRWFQSIHYMTNTG